MVEMTRSAISVSIYNLSFTSNYYCVLSLIHLRPTFLFHCLVYSEYVNMFTVSKAMELSYSFKYTI